MEYRVRDCFELRQVADEYIVIPRGTELLSFNATLVFNESGIFLWNLMKKFVDVDTLSKELANKYSLDISVARVDVEKFLNKMADENIVDIRE
ncbi:MAG: PqqD family protein [Eubacterium sp.]|nr:PqqD family protein [Eubacterium sp.]